MSSYPLLNILLTLCVCLFIAEFIAEKVRLNKPLSYLITGFVTSELLTRNGIDALIRSDSFSSIVFQALLPLVLFEMTLSLVKPNRVELAKCTGLAVYLMVIFVSIASLIVYFLIGHPEHFPLIAAILAIAIIAAVEPACSRLNVNSVNLNNKIRSQIEVETLVNDALAAILFSFALMIAQGQLLASELGGNLILSIFQLIFGGIFSGVVFGYTILFLERLCHSKASHLLLSLCLVYGSYFIAETLLASSGVVSVLTAGLIFRFKLSRKSFFRPLKSAWNGIGFYADAWLFFLLGMTFTQEMFTQRWLAMLIIILALVVGRVFAGVSGYYIFRPYQQNVSAKPMLNGVIFGNYSGALAIALVLSLPEELPYWWTIQSMVFGVVLYSVLIQLPLFNYFARKIP